MNPNNIAIWFELPAIDLARAVRFYETVLAAPLRVEECMGKKIAVFDRDGAEVKGALMEQTEGFRPGGGGLVYLNAGPDLAPALARVEAAGGQVVMPKTALPENWGFIAHFTDSEGNLVGLHSIS